jgi:hypothetical protein
MDGRRNDYLGRRQGSRRRFEHRRQVLRGVYLTLANTHSYIDANTNSNSNIDEYGYAQCYAFSHSYHDFHCNSHFYAYSHIFANAERDTNSENQSNAALSPEPTTTTVTLLDEGEANCSISVLESASFGWHGHNVRRSPLRIIRSGASAVTNSRAHSRAQSFLVSAIRQCSASMGGPLRRAAARC